MKNEQFPVKKEKKVKKVKEEKKDDAKDKDEEMKEDVKEEGKEPVKEEIPESLIDEQRLFVMNLPFEIENEDIRVLFEPHGKVQEIELPMKYK